jgi:LysM repeat protein
MLGRQSPQSIFDSYRKKRDLLPTLLAITAILLVIIGIVIIILWVSGGGFKINIFKKEPTPTSTLAPTPVLSPTASLIPTESPTPTVTVSPTPSAPFEYEVQEGETCYGIAEKYDVDLATLLAINNFTGGGCPIIPGQKIKVPAPGQTLPTASPVPADAKSGTKITYTIQSGDSLASIANQFNSTVDDIIAQNKGKFDDTNNIQVGLDITVRVNIVTPTPTFAPTSTLAPTSTPTS